jgi:hypothetical protein
MMDAAAPSRFLTSLNSSIGDYRTKMRNRKGILSGMSHRECKLNTGTVNRLTV